MNKFAWCFFISVLLCGCIPKYESHYTYYPPKTPQGKYCIAQCSKSRANCQHTCNLNYYACEARERSSGVYDFRQYQRQIQMIGDTQKMTLDAFGHKGHCRQECGCTRNFNSCYRACGGVVVTHKRCVGHCNWIF